MKFLYPLANNLSLAVRVLVFIAHNINILADIPNPSLLEMEGQISSLKSVGKRIVVFVVKKCRALDTGAIRELSEIRFETASRTDIRNEGRDPKGSRNRRRAPN